MLQGVLYMKIREALKSDKIIIFDMLNYNKLDISISLDIFENIYDTKYKSFYIILHKNIRIGVIYDKQAFINPIYWEKIDFNEIQILMDSIL